MSIRRVAKAEVSFRVDQMIGCDQCEVGDLHLNGRSVLVGIRYPTMSGADAPIRPMDLDTLAVFAKHFGADVELPTSDAHHRELLGL